MSDQEEEETPVSEEVTFKKRKRRGNLRAVESKPEPDDAGKETIRNSDNEDEDLVDWTTLGDYRELKRAKRRVQNGINVLDLLNVSKKKTVDQVKPEKREGGLTDAKTLASELDLGNTFSIETNRRDEDAELMKYVEEELAKRRPQTAGEAGDSGIPSAVKLNATDDLLIRVIPEHLLKVSSEAKAKNEEMLSSQMLSGIPEIDLGIEERIRNIEKTEAARTKLLQEKIQQLDKARSRNESDVSLVPSNLASCFTRHNNIVQQAANASNHRFSQNSAPNTDKDMIEHFRDDSGSKGGNKAPPKQTYDVEPVVVLGAEPQQVRLPKPMDKDRRMPGKDKPMDDYIFEKFRKHIKKH